MLIDWFTVVAQIINFLVLLALLKWLLFDRIVRAMDEREDKIAERLHDADQKYQQAEQRAADVEQERQQLESQRQELLENAQQEAKERREELLARVHEEVDQLREDWRQGVEEQQQEVVQQFSQHAGQTLQQSMEQALHDLADVSLQHAAVRQFLNRLEQLEDKQRQELLDELRQADAQLVILTAEELPEELREQIDQALKQQLDESVSTSYEISAELISGLEIRARGRAIGWNLRNYLDEFSESLTTALREQIQPTVSGAE